MIILEHFETAINWHEFVVDNNTFRKELKEAVKILHSAGDVRGDLAWQPCASAPA